MSLTFLMLCALVLSASGTFLVFRLAPGLGLVSRVVGRSSHSVPTPNGGGVGIVIVGTVFGGWLAWGKSGHIWAIIGFAAPLAVIGLLDDIRHRPARLRLLVQVAVVAGWLVFLGDLARIVWGPSSWITLHGVSSLTAAALFALLLLAGVWWINLFNFMDGIDGIAGLQAMYMLLAGAGLALQSNALLVGHPVWMLTVCIASGTAGFLLFNWPPARIFMGDVGSTWLAFTLFALATLSVAQGWVNLAVWIVLAAVFVTDATVTLLVRMARGDRWYEAHNCHVYQRLARQWSSDRTSGHRAVSLLVVAIDLIWLTPLAWACLAWPQWSWLCVLAAYFPLVVGALALGAGRPVGQGQ